VCFGAWTVVVYIIFLVLCDFFWFWLMAARFYCCWVPNLNGLCCFFVLTGCEFCRLSILPMFLYFLLAMCGLAALINIVTPLAFLDSAIFFCISWLCVCVPNFFWWLCLSCLLVVRFSFNFALDLIILGRYGIMVCLVITSLVVEQHRYC
jgi:hypothetical protein